MIIKSSCRHSLKVRKQPAYCIPLIPRTVRPFVFDIVSYGLPLPPCPLVSLSKLDTPRQSAIGRTFNFLIITYLNTFVSHGHISQVLRPFVLLFQITLQYRTAYLTYLYTLPILI